MMPTLTTALTVIVVDFRQVAAAVLYQSSITAAPENLFVGKLIAQLYELVDAHFQRLQNVAEGFSKVLPREFTIKPFYHVKPVFSRQSLPPNM
jgi:hypothetical protein